MWIRATQIWYLSNGPASRPNCCRAALLFRAEKENQKLMGLTFSPTRKIFDLKNESVPGKKVWV